MHGTAKIRKEVIGRYIYWYADMAHSNGINRQKCFKTRTKAIQYCELMGLLITSGLPNPQEQKSSKFTFAEIAARTSKVQPCHHMYLYYLHLATTAPPFPMNIRRNYAAKANHYLKLSTPQSPELENRPHIPEN